jgi:hypothetical protein
MKKTHLQIERCHLYKTVRRGLKKRITSSILVEADAFYISLSAGAFYSLAHRLQLFHYTKLPTAGCWRTRSHSANERNNGRPHRAGAHCYTWSREHGITFWSEGVKQLSVPM